MKFENYYSDEDARFNFAELTRSELEVQDMIDQLLEKAADVQRRMDEAEKRRQLNFNQLLFKKQSAKQPAWCAVQRCSHDYENNRDYVHECVDVADYQYGYHGGINYDSYM